MHVLAIDDDDQFVDLMRSHLRKRGFVVDTAATLAKGLALARRGIYEAILVDLTLPDGDGKVIVTKLRDAGHSEPIIILSARGGIVERIGLLEAGADDYLVKPFDLDELVARIRAIERRTNTQERQVYGNLAFDQRNRLASVGGRPVILRPRETALLELLLRNAGDPVDRETLLSNLYRIDEKITSNALDFHVHRLRSRLSEAGALVSIVTVRTRGYALQVDA